MKRYSLEDLQREFANDDICLEWIKERRWPKGIHCSKCGRVTKHRRVKGRRAYECDYCRRHIYPTAGTVVEKSTTPLTRWFYIAYRLGASRGNISAKQLQRETGITYKTAWRVHRLIAPTVSDYNQRMRAGERPWGARLKLGEPSTSGAPSQPGGKAVQEQITKRQFYWILGKLVGH